MKIFGGGADHRGATDVDILNEFVEVHTLFAGSLFEGVEIDYDHIDGLNAVFSNRCAVCRIFAAMQNSPVHLRMERFNTAIQHFGEAGQVGDVFYFDSRVAQELGGSAGGDEFN